MMVSALIEREVTGVNFPLRSGAFVAVVGPSGAGKDTILGYAREIFSGENTIDFVRRVITRPCDGSSEIHDTLDDEAFAEAEAAGAFALSWNAHGLNYGLPSSVDSTVAKGRVAIANVSRAVVPALRARYANVAIVEITARPEILAERLSARGREKREEIMARLARSAAIETVIPGVVTIDNSGPYLEAGERFVAVVRKAIAYADISETI